MMKLLKRCQFMMWLVLFGSLSLPLVAFGADHVVDHSENIPCVLWCRGCTPTATTMVIGYWDRGDAGWEWFGMGRLIDYWREYTRYSDGTGSLRNVPNLLEELRIDMKTNVDGETWTNDIGPGIEKACNDRNGYDFDSDQTTCSGAIWPFGNDWCWDEIRSEIDNNRPFVWSVGIEDQVGHSLCALGYTDSKYVITYNTWQCPAWDYWYYKEYNNGQDIDWGYVDTVVPGGWTWGQTSLTYPDGGEVWTVGKTYNITWYEFDDRTWSADLYYSADGGVNWTYLALVEPSSPGWKSYAWTVPTSVTATNKARVKIENYSGSSSSWVYQAGDGSEANFTIVRDQTAPTPNPMSWATEPYEVSTSEISMLATTASDSFSPVEYYFNFYSSPTGGSGGTNSSWQTSTYYSDTGLQPNHQYGYRVMARDSSPDHNQTSYSIISYEYTDIETPTGVTFGIISTNSIQARSISTPSGLTRGNSGLLISNTTAGTSSPWKQDNNYWTSSGLNTNTAYSFSARARNGDGDMTPWSPSATRYTLSNTPGASPFSNIIQTSIRANWTANGNPSGTQYFCENTTAGTNSGWTTNTYWASTGLTCGTSYSFRVKARNGDSVETDWTSLGSQSTQECPNVILFTPNGGEVIPSGTNYTIQWGAPSEAASFKLKYSMNNGKAWKLIYSGITSTSYSWPVPTPPKNETRCLVKVIGYDASGKKVGADNSDSAFTIEVLTVTSPNGGETLTSGDPYTLTWTTRGTKRPVAKVKLKYTKNGGEEWIPIHTFKGENPGTYDWTPDVPKTKSKCMVKVVLKDAGGNTVGSDTSDGYFTIQP